MTLQYNSPDHARIEPVVLQELIKSGEYTRPIKFIGKNHRLHDVISEAPMSTQFAISRFFVPYLVKKSVIEHRKEYDPPAKYGWAMFVDCDIMCRHNLTELFNLVERHPEKAVFCVKHNHHVEIDNSYKKDAQVQTRYARKNWSSVMLFNVDHPSNDKLNLKLLNLRPGRDLHAFCWLKDKEIGELPLEWNWLVNVSEPCDDPAIVHFTEGGPWLHRYRDVPFADEWHANLVRWLK
jgi:hypothetical protein